MYRNMKIAPKIIIISFLIITVSISIVSYIGFYVAKRSIENTRIPALESIADFKVAIIEAFFNERAADIRTAQDYYNIKTNLPIMTQYAMDRTNPAYIAAKKMLDGQLKTFQNVYEYIDVMLVSKDGKIVYGTNEAHAEGDLDSRLPCPDREMTFEAGKKGIYFTTVFRNRLEGYEFEMIVIAPVHDFNGKFVGCIAFEIDMEHVYKFVQNTTGLGKTGETLIGKRTSVEVLTVINTLRHDKEAALKRKVAFGEKAMFSIQEAALGRNGYGLTSDYRDEEVLAAWRYIPSLDWGLVVKIDKREAFGLITQLKIVTIVSSSGILVFALIGITFFSRTITSPVKRLSDAACKISNGDMTAQITVKSKDEIGMLARSFDTMRIKVAKLLKDIGEAKRDWESTFDSVKEIIIIYGKDHKIIRCNNELLSRLNARPEDIIGKRCYEVLYCNENEQKRYCEVIKTFKTMKPSTIERESTDLHGIFLFSTFPRFNDEGKFIGVVQIIRDITEQKRAQEELMESYKMSSVGRLTAGVVHEILNPLNIIASHVQLLLMEVEKGSRAEEDLKSIQEEIGRIVTISDGLLIFSRKKEIVAREVDTNNSLEGTISIVEPDMKLNNIRFIRKFDDSLPIIKADNDGLRQVFLNVITNARDAMPEGGALTISTQSVKVIGKSFVRIKFTDTGCGISSEDIDKLFDPFFTTKEVGKGTGLGLSISYGIIKDQGGTINVESEEGKGTTFIIDLPC